MPLEILVFWGLLCLVFIFLAELRPQFRIMGILGSIMLIPLAFWVWTTGVEIQTGQLTTITETTNTTINGSLITGTDTNTKTLTPITFTYFDIGPLLSLILFAMTIYGTSHYALSSKSYMTTRA